MIWTNLALEGHEHRPITSDHRSRGPRSSSAPTWERVCGSTWHSHPGDDAMTGMRTPGPDFLTALAAGKLPPSAPSGPGRRPAIARSSSLARRADSSHGSSSGFSRSGRYLTRLELRKRADRFAHRDSRTTAENAASVQSRPATQLPAGKSSGRVARRTARQ